jgi:hypothetical protein
MFCRFGSDEDSRPVVVAASAIAGVHPARLRMHVALERVGVGRLQLRELAPFEQSFRQLVALPRESSSTSRRSPIGRSRSCGRRAGPSCRTAVADLLRRAGRERLAAHLLDLGLEPGERLGEIARQARQDLAVDGDARISMRAITSTSGRSRRVVDRCPPLGGRRGLRAATAGASRRPSRRHTRSPCRPARGRSRRGLAGAGDLLEVDGRVPRWRSASSVNGRPARP